MHGFKCFYDRKSIDVYAESQLAARDKAVAQLKVPKSKVHMVSVVLCEKDVYPATGKGTQVLHSTAAFG